MSIQNRVSITLSPRMRKALELAAGLDGSTTATYAAQLLSATISKEIKDSTILNDKMAQLDKQALEKESWDDIVSPMTVPGEEMQAEQLQGWFLSGDNPDGYLVGNDKSVVYKTVSSGFIRSKRDYISGFGTLMQQTDITNYIGKKLRLAAVIKTDHVKDWAGLWARIDGKDKKMLWFDNMQDRPIKGTADWTKYEIAFDIPKESATLNFGILLVGAGKVWINGVSLVELSGNKKTPVKDLSVALDF